MRSDGGVDTPHSAPRAARLDPPRLQVRAGHGGRYVGPAVPAMLTGAARAAWLWLRAWRFARAVWPSRDRRIRRHVLRAGLRLAIEVGPPAARTPAPDARRG